MDKSDRDWIDSAVEFVLSRVSKPFDDTSGPRPMPVSFVADHIAWDHNRDALYRAAGKPSEDIDTLLHFYGLRINGSRQRFYGAVRGSLNRLTKRGIAHEMRGDGFRGECKAWILKLYDHKEGE